MKKVLFILSLYLLPVASVFANVTGDVLNSASTGNICKEASCYENQVKKLIETNEKLQKENESLSLKYEEFKKPLDNYIKALDEKRSAYDLLVSQFQFLVWLIGGILSIFLIFFGFKTWPEFVERTKIQLKSELATDLDRIIKDTTKSELSGIENKLDLKIENLSLKFTYEKIKELKTSILDDINIDKVGIIKDIKSSPELEKMIIEKVKEQLLP